MDKITNVTIECNSMNELLLDGSCKIMEGKFGGAFFAKYCFDRSSGTGFILLLLQYPDGVVVPIPLCKNVCKIATDENAGVEKAPAQFPDKDTEWAFTAGGKKTPEVTPPVKYGFQHSSVKDFNTFIKYERPDFPIPMKKIWERIMANWEKLTVDSWSKDVIWDDVYVSLLELGENNALEHKVLCDENVVYLSKENLIEVADEYDIRMQDLRKAFDRRHLWKKDSETIGYQFSKKINGKNQRFYCLKKMNSSVKIKISTDFCTEYSER